MTVNDAHEIKLPCGRVALIDAADLHLTEGYVLLSDVRERIVYVRCWVPGTSKKYVYLHVLILGTKPVDHKNKNGLDCRRSNIRPCTIQQNNFNSRKRARKNVTSIYKGVTFKRSLNKWVAQLWIGRRYIYGGLHKSEIEAARRYDELARIHHGEFAGLNFPVSGDV